MDTRLLFVLVALTAAWGPASLAPGDAARPVVETEELVATCREPGNGAGPLWCYGAPLIARTGDRLFASVMETGEGVPLLCNARWRLFVRDAAGWRLARAAEGYRHREPCPLGLAGRDRLLLSVNPSTQPPGTQYGPCDPHVLRFDARRPDAEPAVVRPAWEGEPHFTDHSYRGFAVDSRTGEALALNIDAETSAQHWALLDSAGRTTAKGQIRFPIRACYPQVALRRGAAHVLAVGDIVEPREEWRAYKKAQTGREWDYVFRRLFYAWTPDACRKPFGEPTEVDTVEETGGHIANLDLWLAPDGAAHLLYLKHTLTQPLGARFFPGVKAVTTLEHVVVRDGRVVSRSAVLIGGEGALPGGTPVYARFHAAPGGALWVVTCIQTGRGVEDRVMQLLPKPGPLYALDLKQPFTTFFTACERGGSRPSRLLDLFGIAGDGTALRYARVRLP